MHSCLDAPFAHAVFEREGPALEARVCASAPASRGKDRRNIARSPHVLVLRRPGMCAWWWWAELLMRSPSWSDALGRIALWRFFSAFCFVGLREKGPSLALHVHKILFSPSATILV